MPEDSKLRSARQAVKAAQAEFDRDWEAAEATRRKATEKRRKAFAKAQKEGLSTRDIGDEVGIHGTRISQIIRGE
jgi:DNA-directed RNA polymerase specialized sigma24 family protein